MFVMFDTSNDSSITNFVEMDLVVEFKVQKPLNFLGARASKRNNDLSLVTGKVNLHRAIVQLAQHSDDITKLTKSLGAFKTILPKSKILCILTIVAGQSRSL